VHNCAGEINSRVGRLDVFMAVKVSLLFLWTAMSCGFAGRCHIASQLRRTIQTILKSYSFLSTFYHRIFNTFGTKCYEFGGRTS
jgi:hypothetical protein